MDESIEVLIEEYTAKRADYRARIAAVKEKLALCRLRESSISSSLYNSESLLYQNQDEILSLRHTLRTIEVSFYRLIEKFESDLMELLRDAESYDLVDLEKFSAALD